MSNNKGIQWIACVFLSCVFVYVCTLNIKEVELWCMGRSGGQGRVEIIQMSYAYVKYLKYA